MTTKVPLVTVQDLGTNSETIVMNDLVSPSETLIKQIADPLSSTTANLDPGLKNTFLLRAQQNIILRFFTVAGFTDQGIPLPDQLLEAHELQPEQVLVFRHLVPEGMPNLLLRAQGQDGHYYWYPRFSGMDGSLELDPGFTLFMGH